MMMEYAPMGERKLDQFYTLPKVAEDCVRILNAHLKGEEYLWIEPAAGKGAFLGAVAGDKIGLDIDPAGEAIITADFLTWRPEDISRSIVVFGNPPFGKNASLARRFFNHAATFASIIAFILPRTFEKTAFINTLCRTMHPVHTIKLSPWSFEYQGRPYDVPTVFQIWEKRAHMRPIKKASLTHRDFDFVTAPSADFAFQRVGARAGLVSKEGLKKSPQSHYFLKANTNPQDVFQRLSSIDWSPIKHCTAGNPSIGKGELIKAYCGLAQ